MSSGVKFEHASFYDAALGDWIKITPPEFVEEKHAGQIECTTMNCHASLSYVSSHDREASNGDVGGYFRTNSHGESHAEHCGLNPDPAVQNSLGMLEALEAGKAILLNINFACSPIKDKGKLIPKLAREKMPLLGGSFRQDWIAAHRGEYASYSGYSAEKLAQDAGAYRRALQHATDPTNGQLIVSYLHGVFPWSKFYAKDQAQVQPSRRSQLTDVDIFENLFEELEKKESLQTAWRSAPALRHGVKLLKSARDTSSSMLFTNFRDKGGNISNAVEIDGNRFTLQDVIRVNDPATKAPIQSAKEFSLVATPYVERANVQRSLENGGPLHIYWPINSAAQLILST